LEIRTKTRLIAKIERESVMARPSDDRRRMLKENNLVCASVSNIFPLKNYYKMADNIHQRFQDTYSIACRLPIPDNYADAIPVRDAIDDAYVYGQRYCKFYLEGLRGHDYFDTIGMQEDKHKHANQVALVLGQIEKLVDRMDIVEIKRQEAEEQVNLLKFAEIRDRVEQQKKKSSSSSMEDVSASALSKLLSLQPGYSTGQRIQRDPSGEEPAGQSSTRYAIEDSDEENELVPLPPPAMPTADAVTPGSVAPPSYDQVIGGRQEKPQPPAQKLPLKQQQKLDEREYNNLVSSGNIRLSSIKTYQGRNSSSTNGCAVISALVAGHHLASRNISDSKIMNVIDSECGPILRLLRAREGVKGNAYMCPSDVHDYFVDEKLLPQEKFLGATGGNILDSDHRREFVKCLAQAYDVGAGDLFFREHVVSVVKYNSGNGHYNYDLIDSLPGKGGYATRFSCQNLEALDVLLRWYTSKKFSGEHARHADKVPWDDMMSEADPRVYQGFVWGDQAPKNET